MGPFPRPGDGTHTIAQPVFKAAVVPEVTRWVMEAGLAVLWDSTGMSELRRCFVFKRHLVCSAWIEDT